MSKRIVHRKAKDESDLTQTKFAKGALLMTQDSRVAKLALDELKDFAKKHGSIKAACVAKVAKAVAAGEKRKTVKLRDVAAGIKGVACD
jgi:histone H3/H4